MRDIDLGKMFAAGAKKGAIEQGMCEKDAEMLSMTLCKEARPRRRLVVDDYDEDDEETLWDKIKPYAIPTGIGLGAFLLGADAGRYGRKDWNYFSNAGGRLLEGLKNLLGVPDSDLWRSVAVADPKKLHDTEPEVTGSKFPLTLNGRMPTSVPASSVLIDPA